MPIPLRSLIGTIGSDVGCATSGLVINFFTHLYTLKTMKYKIQYSILTVAALSLTACSNDDALASGQHSEPVAGEQIGFATTIGDGLDLQADEDLDGTDAATRATMVDGAFGTWATTDNISVSDGTLMYSYQPKEGSISGAKCTFEAKSGKASFLTDGTGQDGTFYAFYPADAVLGWKGATVTTMIYTEQKYSENVENSGVMGPYMAAVATTTGGGANASFTFGHICSVVDVDLSTFDGGEVESVALCSNSKVSLAGRMAYNASTKEASVSTDDGDTYFSNRQSDVVVVSDINLATPVVRFFVLPVKQTAGLTITVRTTEGNYYTKSTSNAVGTSDANVSYLASVSGVTSGTVCKPYYKKYKFGAIGTAKTNRWMAMIPGSTYFSMLSTPGSHDSATSGVRSSYSDQAKCQSETIAQQLENGVRAFDLRPQYKSSSTITADNLTIYHGTVSTGVLYKDAIATIVDFLDKNPTEAISIIMTKEEASGDDQTSTLIDVVTSIHNNYSSYFKVLDHTYYTLKDFRGKILYGCRPNWYVSGMTRVENWPDDNSVTDYTVNVGYCKASVEDAYNTSGDSKKTLVNNMLDMASSNTNNGRLHYTFTSVAWKLFGSSISTHANTQNPAVATYIANTLTGPAGYVYADYMGSSSYSGNTLLKTIVAQNLKYVYKNRTRCSAVSTSGTDTGVDISADEYADGGTVYVKHQ